MFKYLFINKTALPARTGGSKQITIKLMVLAARLVFLSACLFQACSDDVVNITDEFDPPRFNWRTAYIPNVYDGFSSIWAQDTGKIFLVNNFSKSLYIVSGGNTIIYPVGNYGMHDIKGISNNEIYIFGAMWFPSNKLTIIKWNGGGFEYFETGLIVNTGYGIKGLIANTNEIWITSSSGISKFDGLNFTNYSFEDPLLTTVDFFVSNNNKIQYIAERFIDTLHIQQSLFEFRDTGFVCIHNYIIMPYPNRTGIFLKEIDGIKYGLELNEPLGKIWSICINNFTGTSFTPYFCFNNKISAPLTAESNNPVGNNLQDFMFLVQAAEFGFFEHTRYGIIHWNGSRGSKEIELHNNDFVLYHNNIIFKVNQNNFIILEPGIGNDFAKLYYGSRK